MFVFFLFFETIFAFFFHSPLSHQLSIGRSWTFCCHWFVHCAIIGQRRFSFSMMVENMNLHFVVCYPPPPPFFCLFDCCVSRYGCLSGNSINVEHVTQFLSSDPTVLQSMISWMMNTVIKKILLDSFLWSIYRNGDSWWMHLHTAVTVPSIGLEQK